MVKNRVRPWHCVLGALVIAAAALATIWNWDWFIPPVAAIAGGRLHRPVQIAHLRVALGRHPVLVAEGVVIGNPPGFPAPGPFARIARLSVTLDGAAWLHRQAVIVPAIELDRPEVAAIALSDGRNNWTFPFSGAPPGRPGASARIGELRIAAGHVHVVDPKVKADFEVAIATREAGAGRPAQLLAEARGTYAGQPITARFAGGALLSLRDKAHPYPVDLALANGTTQAVLRGTVQDPLAFAGTNLTVELAGQSLSHLMPLTGIPAPETPPFRLTAMVVYADRHLRLEDLQGRLGNSDLEGRITVDPDGARPLITAELRSRRVDLADLGGFAGGTPGRLATPGQTPEKRQEVARAEASPYLIPHTPLALPRLRAAEVRLRYRGERIEGRSMPLDNLEAELTVRNGALQLRPLSFGVGRGRIAATIAAEQTGPRELATKAEIEVREVDLARLLAATHRFGGAGMIGGSAVIEGKGDSLAAILGGGNGEVKLFMSGGDLSALLVDLSGLEFGNALLSTLGLPKRTDLRCLVSDFALVRGILRTRTLVIDTGEARITGAGEVDLRDETVNYRIKTEPKHFTIGSLPAPIDITGRLKKPAIGPEAKDVALRGGIAAALGIVLTPLAALLPTIQLGLGKDTNCSALIREAANAPPPRGVPAPPR